MLRKKSVDGVAPQQMTETVTAPAASAPRSSNRSLTLSAIGISATSALNIVLGFALQILLAALFGAGVEMDAFLAATTLPNLLTMVLFGALSVTFVPVFIEYQTHGNDREAWTVVGGFLIIAVTVLLAVMAALALFAEPVLLLTVPGFTAGSSELALTQQLFYVMLPTVVLSAVAGLLRSIYHAQRRFMVAAWVPALNSLVLVVASLALAPALGIMAVAVATLLGGIAQLLLVAPAFGRIFPLEVGPALRHPGVRRVLLLMLPWVLSAIFYKSNTVIDRFVASQLDTGTISVLGYAYRLMTAISQVLTQGISMVFFPLMAAYVATGEGERQRAAAGRGIRLTLLVALPAAVFMVVAGEPLVRVLFEYGRFDARATAQTAMMLDAYLGAFVAGSVGSVLTYVFYARQDTLTVAFVGLSGFFVNLLAALLLTPALGGVAPAYAFSLASVWNLALLGVLLVRQMGGPRLPSLLAFMGKLALACGLAGAVWAYGSAALAQGVPLPRHLDSLLFGALAIAGAVVYIIACVALRVGELDMLARLLATKLRRKTSHPQDLGGSRE